MLGLLISRAEVESSFRSWLDGAVGLLPALTMAVVVLVLTTLVAKGASSSATRGFTRASGDPRAGRAWGRIVNYVVLLLGVVVALAVAGVNLGAMMVAVGAVGFGIAFAMQDTIANFISGLIILTTHPFASGDTVEINGATGKVEQITIRSTRLKTFDGLKVEVPNRAVLANNITVLSYNPTRRWEVTVGIGYDDDVRGAVETAFEATKGVDDVLEDPEPDVLVDSLGDSAVNLKVRFWVNKEARGNMLLVRSDVTRAVKEALVAAGYDIPYPIRTILMEDQVGNAEATEAGGSRSGP